jgi:hypothetical protein
LKGRSNSTLIHDTVNPSELCHRRFSHLHYKALLSVRKMVTRLPKIQAKPKEYWTPCTQMCVERRKEQGKNMNHSFPNNDSKSKRVLDTVHSDVCGTKPTNSLRGYVYYVSFIDDYSSKTWIYLLKAKNEVFGKFKEFNALVENQIEWKIKTLRSDNGG